MPCNSAGSNAMASCLKHHWRAMLMPPAVILSLLIAAIHAAQGGGDVIHEPSASTNTIHAQSPSMSGQDYVKVLIHREDLIEVPASMATFSKIEIINTHPTNSLKISSMYMGDGYFNLEGNGEPIQESRGDSNERGIPHLPPASKSFFVMNFEPVELKAGERSTVNVAFLPRHNTMTVYGCTFGDDCQDKLQMFRDSETDVQLHEATIVFVSSYSETGATTEGRNFTQYHRIIGSSVPNTYRLPSQVVLRLNPSGIQNGNVGTGSLSLFITNPHAHIELQVHNVSLHSPLNNGEDAFGNSAYGAPWTGGSNLGRTDVEMAIRLPHSLSSESPFVVRPAHRQGMTRSVPLVYLDWNIKKDLFFKRNSKDLHLDSFCWGYLHVHTNRGNYLTAIDVTLTHQSIADGARKPSSSSKGTDLGSGGVIVNGNAGGMTRFDSRTSLNAETQTSSTGGSPHSVSAKGSQKSVTKGKTKAILEDSSAGVDGAAQPFSCANTREGASAGMECRQRSAKKNTEAPHHKVRTRYQLGAQTGTSVRNRDNATSFGQSDGLLRPLLTTLRPSSNSSASGEGGGVSSYVTTVGNFINFGTLYATSGNSNRSVSDIALRALVREEKVNPVAGFSEIFLGIHNTDAIAVKILRVDQIEYSMTLIGKAGDDEASPVTGLSNPHLHIKYLPSYAGQTIIISPKEALPRIISLTHDLATVQKSCVLRGKIRVTTNHMDSSSASVDIGYEVTVLRGQIDFFHKEGVFWWNTSQEMVSWAHQVATSSDPSGRMMSSTPQSPSRWQRSLRVVNGYPVPVHVRNMYLDGCAQVARLVYPSVRTSKKAQDTGSGFWGTIAGDGGVWQKQAFLEIGSMKSVSPNEKDHSPGRTNPAEKEHKPFICHLAVQTNISNYALPIILYDGDLQLSRLRSSSGDIAIEKGNDRHNESGLFQATPTKEVNDAKTTQDSFIEKKYKTTVERAFDLVRQLSCRNASFGIDQVSYERLQGAANEKQRRKHRWSERRYLECLTSSPSFEQAMCIKVQLLVGSIAAGRRKSVRFFLTNFNPVPITIYKKRHIFEGMSLRLSRRVADLMEFFPSSQAMMDDAQNAPGNGLDGARRRQSPETSILHHRTKHFISSSAKSTFFGSPLFQDDISFSPNIRASETDLWEELYLRSKIVTLHRHKRENSFKTEKRGLESKLCSASHTSQGGNFQRLQDFKTANNSCSESRDFSEKVGYGVLLSVDGTSEYVLNPVDDTNTLLNKTFARTWIIPPGGVAALDLLIQAPHASLLSSDVTHFIATGLELVNMNTNETLQFVVQHEAVTGSIMLHSDQSCHQCSEKSASRNESDTSRNRFSYRKARHQNWSSKRFSGLDATLFNEIRIEASRSDAEGEVESEEGRVLVPCMIYSSKEVTSASSNGYDDSSKATNLYASSTFRSNLYLVDLRALCSSGSFHFRLKERHGEGLPSGIAGSERAINVAPGASSVFIGQVQAELNCRSEVDGHNFFACVYHWLQERRHHGSCGLTDYCDDESGCKPDRHEISRLEKTLLDRTSRALFSIITSMVDRYGTAGLSQNSNRHGSLAEESSSPLDSDLANNVGNLHGRTQQGDSFSPTVASLGNQITQSSSNDNASGTPAESYVPPPSRAFLDQLDTFYNLWKVGVRFYRWDTLRTGAEARLMINSTARVGDVSETDSFGNWQEITLPVEKIGKPNEEPPSSTKLKLETRFEIPRISDLEGDVLCFSSSFSHADGDTSKNKLSKLCQNSGANLVSIAEVVKGYVEVYNPTGIPLTARLIAAAESNANGKVSKNSIPVKRPRKSTNDQLSSFPRYRSSIFFQNDPHDAKPSPWWIGGSYYMYTSSDDALLQSNHNITIKSGSGTHVSLINPSMQSVNSFCLGCGKRCNVRNQVMNADKLSSPIGAASAFSNENNLLIPKSLSPIKVPPAFALSQRSMVERTIPPGSSVMLGPIYFRPPTRGLFQGEVLIENSLTGAERISLVGGGGTEKVIFESPRTVFPFRSSSLHMQEERSKFEESSNIEFRFGKPTLVFSGSSPPTSKGSTNMKELYVVNAGDTVVDISRVYVSSAELYHFTNMKPHPRVAPWLGAQKRSCTARGFHLVGCQELQADNPAAEAVGLSPASENIQDGFILSPGQNKSLTIEHNADCSFKTMYVSLNFEFRRSSPGRVSRSRYTTEALLPRKTEVLLGYDMNPVEMKKCRPSTTELFVARDQCISCPGGKPSQQTLRDTSFFDMSEFLFQRVIALVLLFVTCRLAYWSFHLRENSMFFKSPKLPFERSDRATIESTKDRASTFGRLSKADVTSGVLVDLGKEQTRAVILGKYKKRGILSPQCIIATGGFLPRSAPSETGNSTHSTSDAAPSKASGKGGVTLQSTPSAGSGGTTKTSEGFSGSTMAASSSSRRASGQRTHHGITTLGDAIFRGSIRSGQIGGTLGPAGFVTPAELGWRAAASKNLVPTLRWEWDWEDCVCEGMPEDSRVKKLLLSRDDDQCSGLEEAESQTTSVGSYEEEDEDMRMYEDEEEDEDDVNLLIPPTSISVEVPHLSEKGFLGGVKQSESRKGRQEVNNSNRRHRDAAKSVISPHAKGIRRQQSSPISTSDRSALKRDTIIARNQFSYAQETFNAKGHGLNNYTRRNGPALSSPLRSLGGRTGDLAALYKSANKTQKRRSPIDVQHRGTGLIGGVPVTWADSGTRKADDTVGPRSARAKSDAVASSETPKQVASSPSNDDLMFKQENESSTAPSKDEGVPKPNRVDEPPTTAAHNLQESNGVFDSADEAALENGAKTHPKRTSIGGERRDVSVAGPSLEESGNESESGFLDATGQVDDRYPGSPAAPRPSSPRKENSTKETPQKMITSAASYTRKMGNQDGSVQARTGVRVVRPPPGLAPPPGFGEETRIMPPVLPRIHGSAHPYSVTKNAGPTKETALPFQRGSVSGAEESPTPEASLVLGAGVLEAVDVVSPSSTEVDTIVSTSDPERLSTSFMKDPIGDTLAGVTLPDHSFAHENTQAIAEYSLLGTPDAKPSSGSTLTSSGSVPVESALTPVGDDHLWGSKNSMGDKSNALSLLGGENFNVDGVQNVPVARRDSLSSSLYGVFNVENFLDGLLDESLQEDDPLESSHNPRENLHSEISSAVWDPSSGQVLSSESSKKISDSGLVSDTKEGSMTLGVPVGGHVIGRAETAGSSSLGETRHGSPVLSLPVLIPGTALHTDSDEVEAIAFGSFLLNNEQSGDADGEGRCEKYKSQRNSFFANLMGGGGDEN